MKCTTFTMRWTDFSILALGLAWMVLVCGCDSRLARGDLSPQRSEQQPGLSSGERDVVRAFSAEEVTNQTGTSTDAKAEVSDQETIDGEPAFNGQPLSKWLAQLDSANAEDRKEALRAISAIGPRAESAIPKVQKLLQDPDADVQEWACSTLGRIGPSAKVAIPDLEKIILNRQAADKVRWAAAVALGNIGPEAASATPTLLKALEDSDPWLRWAATEGLAGIGPQAKGAAVALARALYDSEYIVRIGAARALVHLAPQIPPKGEPLLSLIHCYEDTSQYDSVRHKVAEAIKAVDAKVAAKLGIK